jgi:fructose-1,6-bisphosphatase/inositol monophosphatase family enzyme
VYFNNDPGGAAIYDAAAFAAIAREAGHTVTRTPAEGPPAPEG